jgi:hypothetical protein
VCVRVRVRARERERARVCASIQAIAHVCMISIVKM